MLPTCGRRRANQCNILQSLPLPMTMELKNIECRTCRRDLEEGMNVLEVQEGIIGKLGFVALGEKLLFCNFACLRNYLDGSKGYVLRRRIP
ncbi:MAG: hypothetical protein IIA33_02095 [Planctomycetes bacterium]|nr:hypothetical protein [Planctomycetota bacterium]